MGERSDPYLASTRTVVDGFSQAMVRSTCVLPSSQGSRSRGKQGRFCQGSIFSLGKTGGGTGPRRGRR